MLWPWKLSAEPRHLQAAGRRIQVRLDTKAQRLGTVRPLRVTPDGNAHIFTEQVSIESPLRVHVELQRYTQAGDLEAYLRFAVDNLAPMNGGVDIDPEGTAFWMRSTSDGLEVHRVPSSQWTLLSEVRP